MISYQHLFIILCVLYLLFQIVKMDETCYRKEDRDIYVNENGYLTRPINHGMNEKMSESIKKGMKESTVEKCFRSTHITFHDYIRLSNFELAANKEGKCFPGCLLHEMHLVDANYNPRTGVLCLVRMLSPVITSFVKSYMFYAKDKRIYGSIEPSKFVKSIIDLGLSCLEQGKKDNNQDKCESMNSFMECIIQHRSFEKIKADSLAVRKINCEYEKNRNAE
ncbi:uncharacterized protein LOC111043376 isoform X1 [Nilaparvata lugens]|uniref:uncharacterized protein LOC111043376 isoform X2 n=1 Tax=Nilaparvata lugens TaxID=108931 RepID=UPI00193DBE8F|nr:uncharacterized protein LOC111043376 isoform X2 [Nilaparvata lugens]XP_039286198.1 uncharacterized protein LOC111043376 isoform X1 [Nilaparvata lugens]